MTVFLSWFVFFVPVCRLRERSDLQELTWLARQVGDVRPRAQPQRLSEPASGRVPVREDAWPVCGWQTPEVSGIRSRQWLSPRCLCDSQGLAGARHPNDALWHVLGGSGGAEKWNSPRRVTNHEYNEVRAASSVSK